MVLLHIKLIRSLVEPGKLDTTPYADIVKLVKKYYDPVPSEIVQRFHFNTRVRAPTESIATFVAALQELSEFCNFGTTLDQMLRDRLVCGVNHEAIQRKLLSEKNLTFEKAYALAQSIETAERDTANLKSKKGRHSTSELHCIRQTISYWEKQATIQFYS